ncbi:unnamed protein product, partial [Prunus brigantina]
IHSPYIIKERRPTSIVVALVSTSNSLQNKQIESCNQFFLCHYDNIMHIVVEVCVCVCVEMSDIIFFFFTNLV